MENTVDRRRHIRRLFEMKRTILLVWSSAKAWTLLNAALLIVQGLLPLATLLLMKRIVDGVSALVSGAPDGNPGNISFLIILAGAVSLLSSLCRSASSLVGEAQSQAVTDHVFGLLHAKSLEADLEYYESPGYYDTLHMAQMEAPYRPVAIVNSILQLLRGGVTVLAMAGLLCSFHWGIAPILVAVALPGFAVRFGYARKLYGWRKRNTPLERLASYFNWMLTHDSHAKEIRLFELGGVFTERFNRLRKRLRTERIRLSATQSIKDFLTQACATAAIFGSLLVLARLTIHGRITLGQMVMLYMAFQRGYSSLREVLGSLATIYENNLFVSNFYRFLDLEKHVVDPPHPRRIAPPLGGGIVFDRVSFRYPGTTRDAVRDISLQIEAGEHVALVGENGAGKTTLVKLLCRLYDPAEGAILADGINLREAAAAEWRRGISVIFQDFAKYQLSARENIWLGNVALPPESDRVAQSARLAGADEMLRSLPDGYDTKLGRWFENGRELSIGQWQKIALARAFVRDAHLLILDEPTSALDAKAEHEVFEKFHELADGRTAVIISHRMSTVRMADRILVLHDGMLVEQGTHEQLLGLGGHYAALYNRQAERYR